MLQADIKVDIKQVAYILPKQIRTKVLLSTRVRKGFKAAALEYLAINQEQFIRNSEHKGTWKPIGFWAVLLRRRGRRPKYKTIGELQAAAKTLPILRDTGSLFQSLMPRARGKGARNRVLRLGILYVETGTKDPKAYKHHTGAMSRYPGKAEMLKKLQMNVVKDITKKGKKAGTKTRKATKKKGKLAKTIKAIKGKIKKKKSKSQRKATNPDYLKLEKMIGEKAGKQFQLPKREILKTPSKAEEERIIVPIRKAIDTEVRRLLNR